MQDLFHHEGLIGLNLDEIAEWVSSCKECRLAENRTRVVPGEGDSDADLLFIGEGPGSEEDRQGKPFVGRAGQKLTEILNSVSIARPQVYITNVVKCRPPENRNPRADEVEACLPYLEAQIAAINPQIIVTLGNSSTKLLLDTSKGITKVRGQFYNWRGGIKIYPMYHPSYLLRYPSREKGSPKHQTWQDIQKIKEAISA